jgi:hypothetical protein
MERQRYEVVLPSGTASRVVADGGVGYEGLEQACRRCMLNGAGAVVRVNPIPTPTRTLVAVYSSRTGFWAHLGTTATEFSVLEGSQLQAYEQGFLAADVSLVDPFSLVPDSTQLLVS